jgi:pimeloyl-ACP methyl ester carboxylesterase
MYEKIIRWSVAMAAASLEAAGFSYPGVRIDTGADGLRCNYTRILPSADLDSIALWRSEEDIMVPLMYRRPGEFLVVSNVLRSSFPKKDSLRFRLFSFLGRLEPLRWAAGKARLYGRMGEDESFYVDYPGGKIEPGPILSESWRNVRLKFVANGDLTILGQPNTLRLLEDLRKRRPLRTAATLSGSASFLHLESGSDFNLRLTTALGTVVLPEKAVFARDLVVFGEEASTLYFLGKQDEQQLFLPYARPLVDLDTGRKAGRYGLTAISWEIDAQRRSHDIEKAGEEPSIIRDAVVQSGVVWALVESETRMRVVRLNAAKADSFELCRKSNFASGEPISIAPQLKGIRRTHVTFGDHKSARSGAMFGLLYLPAGAPRELVVFLHGGPTGTMSGSNLPLVVSRLAPSGKAVLVLEYAGSVGGGHELSDRLPRDGLKALEKDMADLVAWLRNGHFDHVSIIAESFGAVPALIVARDYREMFQEFVFLAPLLRRPDPDSIVTVKGLGQATSENQLRWEEAVFGGSSGREGFRGDLEKLVNGLSASSRFHFFFGEQDHVSSKGDLPPRLLKSGTIESLPRVSHQTLAIQPSVWDRIGEILSSGKERTVGKE